MVQKRLARVYEARGEEKMAAKYYKKTYYFAMSHEGFDQDAANWILSEANRLKANQNIE